MSRNSTYMGVDTPATLGGMTIEEALRQTEERAALLRFTAHAAAGQDDQPSPATWYGIGDPCDQIETATKVIRSALSAHALATEIGRHLARS